MGILVLFEQSSGKFCLMFLALNFECFTKYDAFCLHSFDYACLKATQAYCNEEVRNYGKFLFLALLKMAGGGECISPWIRPCQGFP